MKQLEPPKELQDANDRPFEYNNIVYSPQFRNGVVKRYEGRLENLRIYLYANEIYLCNSIHKYWHGNNHTDFTLSNLKEAIKSLEYHTGIDWTEAIVKKCEIGCNIEENATSIIHSLISYKGKDYFPMQDTGKRYGSVCEFTDYKLKGYDKAFEAKIVTGVSLKYPLFRWEVVYKRIRTIEKYLNLNLVTVKDLLNAQNWESMAIDAISKYENSMRAQRFNLFGLSAHEKGILAVMLNPQFRQEFKIHHKETYKRYRRIYGKLIRDQMALQDDTIVQLLTSKFEELLTQTDVLRTRFSRLVV